MPSSSGRTSGSATCNSDRRTSRWARRLWLWKPSRMQHGARTVTAKPSRSGATFSRRWDASSKTRDVLNNLEATSRERYVPPYAMALVHAGLDERDEVFDWLDKAYVARDVHLIYLPVDPKWDPYRTVPACGAPRQVWLPCRPMMVKALRPPRP